MTKEPDSPNRDQTRNLLDQNGFCQFRTQTKAGITNLANEIRTAGQHLDVLVLTKP